MTAKEALEITNRTRASKSFDERVDTRFGDMCLAIQMAAEEGKTKAYVAVVDDIEGEFALGKLQAAGFQIERTSGSVYNIAIHW